LKIPANKSLIFNSIFLGFICILFSENPEMQSFVGSYEKNTHSSSPVQVVGSPAAGYSLSWSV
jgi:hypothetical protein